MDRSWWRHTLTQDINSAPWLPGQANQYEYEINIGTSASGPFAPAQLTDIADKCTVQPDNRLGVTTATQTVFGVGGVGVLNPGTAYYLEVILHGPGGAEVDRDVCGPVTTEGYPTFVCSASNITTTSADVLLGQTGGAVDQFPPCDQDTIVWDLATAPGGPYTSTAPEDAVTSPGHTFSGLTPNTQYYWRARLRETPANTEYLSTTECTFTTEAVVVTTPPFDPQPCGPGDGGGGVDVENLVLCDTLADGTIVGTALAVYDYTDGVPAGPPTFVDPVTGNPYTPQGTLMVCPGDAGCLEPVLFHRTTTSTGPVEHPGRQYDITLPINPGFAVQSLQVDSTTHAANIVWEVDDPDGEVFRQNLTTFMEGRLPAPAVVTITNPNAGGTICGTAAAMQIHIECLRLDQSPPDLIELIYNAGQDMIINPAYNETPPLNPPVSQGNYGYHLLARQDDPGPFPGNPPANRVNCTNTANRGWETNDIGRTFEIWGQDVAGGVTPTPRGTPIQEITSDGPPPGGISTIWQTFQAPASGNFIIRVVHGARDPGEIHRITLDNGDTDDAQNGTLINDVTTPAVVYGNPWTTFNQTIPLVGGSTYTLAISTTENPPDGNARGGLFTDMRAYIDRPDQRATATTDDDTCSVTVDETTTVCTEELWSPICAGGNIDSWQNAQTGAVLSNAAFWGQAPAPTPGPCPATAADGGGGSVAANLVHTYQVCSVIGGVRTTLQRVVITDASGGVLADSFIGPDGGPVPTPSTYTIGSCTDTAYVNDVLLCDVIPGQGSVSFLRKYVQSLNDTNQGQINSFRDFDFDGNDYTVQGVVSDCGDSAADQETVCFTYTATGGQVHTGTIRHQDGINAQGWLLFDQNSVLIPNTEPGLTFVSCSPDPFSSTGLCLADGTPISVVTRWNHNTGTYIDDGWINLLTGTFSAGAPPVGTQACGQNLSIQTSDVLCDMDTGTGTVNALVLIQYNYNPDGSIASTTVLNAVTGAPYTPVGTITVCPTDTSVPDNDMQVLCDRQADGSLVPFVRDFTRNAVGTVSGFTDYTLAGAGYTVTGTVQSCIPRDSETQILCDSTSPTPVRFIRTYTYAGNGTVSGFTDTTLAGAPFTPTGAVAVCPSATTDSESFILCDSATTPNRFVRTYTYDATGAIAGFTDRTFAGAAFTPTGAVGVCTTTTQTDLDFDQIVLCDGNGTAFIRRYTFNSTTGAVTATTNLTLAGAAFTPVGTVGTCSDCCPQVVGEGCSNTGSGRYTAIRATNGTITLIDSVSGATITSGNVVACPADDPAETLSAQARVVTNASPWTPAEVTGTLTSLTATGTVGLWDLVDASGTALAGLPQGLTVTWSAEDANTLTGPQSITPQVGSSVVVNWTER